MSSRPLIGVATQSLDAIPGKLPPCWVMGRRYVNVLAACGAAPLLLPLLRDEEALRVIYDRLDGIFLTGGVDVDPACYNEHRHDRCDKADVDRDWVEMRLIAWALADRKPVLGVCRGIQIINVACGGTLYQHVPDEYHTPIKHDCFPTATQYTRDYLAHDVTLTAGSLLGRLLGDVIPVNSMHHQGIKRLAPGLRATAFAPDGLVEGAECEAGRYLVGVQWHPEELADDHGPQRHLFVDFLSASGAYASR